MYRPDSPVQLPSGHLVCGTHFLEVCPICTVDYSFMDEIINGSDRGDDDYDDDDEDEDEDDDDLVEFSDSNSSDGCGAFMDNNLRIGTGRIIPDKFTPPTELSTPQLLFPSGYATKASPLTCRFIHRNDPSQLLIYTDGACLGNGTQNPRAGFAFVYRPSTPGLLGHSGRRLENKGPTGEPRLQTSNRAELRAVIAALRFRSWDGEGFRTIVIATVSEYVAEGATSWVRGWLRRGWRTNYGTPVRNRDLWQALFGEFERWSDRGVEIRFWRIPRYLNAEADWWAKDVAARDPVDEFGDILGIMV